MSAKKVSKDRETPLLVLTIEAKVLHLIDDNIFQSIQFIRTSTAAFAVRCSPCTTSSQRHKYSAVALLCVGGVLTLLHWHNRQKTYQALTSLVSSPKAFTMLVQVSGAPSGTLLLRAHSFHCRENYFRPNAVCSGRWSFCTVRLLRGVEKVVALGGSPHDHAEFEKKLHDFSPRQLVCKTLHAGPARRTSYNRRNLFFLQWC